MSAELAQSITRDVSKVTPCFAEYIHQTQTYLSWFLKPNERDLFFFMESIKINTTFLDLRITQFASIAKIDVRHKQGTDGLIDHNPKVRKMKIYTLQINRSQSGLFAEINLKNNILNIFSISFIISFSLFLI